MSKYNYRRSYIDNPYPHQHQYHHSDTLKQQHNRFQPQTTHLRQNLSLAAYHEMKHNESNSSFIVNNNKNIKQMQLIILPNAVDKKYNQEGRDIYSQNDYILKYGEQINQNKSEGEIEGINHKYIANKRKERRVVNSLGRKLDVELPDLNKKPSKSSANTSKSVPKTSQIKLKTQSNKQEEGEPSIQSLGNFTNTKIGRQMKLIKEKLKKIKQNQDNCADRNIKPQNDLNLCNIFSIQSYAMSYSPQISPQRKGRINTQPNLQTNEQVKAEQSRTNSFCFNFKRDKKLKSIKVELSCKPNKQKAVLLKRQLRIPYQTYHYRDFLWKVNLTNQLFIQPPLQYQHRLKVYVGKGNNSCMVRGLISRRYWFAFTDRIEQANFVWTQLKQQSYFKIQKQSQFRNTNQQQQDNYKQKSILSGSDAAKYKKYISTSFRIQENGDQRLLCRIKAFSYRSVIRPNQIKNGKMHNHFMHNFAIGNKKALFALMHNYYQSSHINTFEVLPLTFHISKGIQDNNFLQFQRHYHHRNRQIRKNKQNKMNLWIVKPGQNTNRGFGIKLCLNLQQIKAIIKPQDKWPDGSDKTYIIQSYIEKPLLYQKRKFDLRHYILLTRVQGCLKGYWYKDGYVRTTSSEYRLDHSLGAIHLTNDAVQKLLPDYGKYEKGNKLSYDQLDAHIVRKYQGRSFYQHVYPKMKTIGVDIMKACSGCIDPQRLQDNFQLFGLDFMIDHELNVWLIQVNSNPCLQLSCPLLDGLIPNLIQNVLEITLDAKYPPPIRYSPKMPRYCNNMQQINKLQLVFDERYSGCFQNQMTFQGKLAEEQDDVFEDDGDEWQQN